MAVRVWKEVLLPGRQRDARGNWFAFGPRDIRRAHANVTRMLSRGVPVPCVWEHQDVEAGDPEEWKARYAKHTFGHVAGARVNARGALELLHEVPGTRDAEQLARTRFVSPKVYRGYSDSRGGEYRGATIAHVAATPTPVQYWQRPFELSRRDALYLSYTPGDPPMADEKDDDDKGGGDKGKKGGDAEGGEAGQFTKLLDALREAGLTIPEEVTDIPGLIIAVKASGGADGGDDGLPDIDDDAEGSQVSGATAPSGGGAPMLMSDDRARGYAKRERVDLERRVKELFKTGRVDRPTAQRLLRQVDAVELSFTAAGDLTPTKLVHQVEAYEALPKGVVWSKTGRRPDAAELSATREVDPPARMTGGGTADEVVKEQERLAGLYSVSKK